MKQNPVHLDTRLCHVGLCTDEKTGAISTPIYQTATFRHRGPDQSTGYDYSRSSNPTRTALEQAIAQLENGHTGFAFSTGMAAIAAVCGLFKPGQTILASDDLYGGTYRYFEKFLKPIGITMLYVDTSDFVQVQAIFKSTQIAGLFLESPTNPIMKISDIRKLSDLAKSHNALVIADNTFMSPLLQLPLDLGADIVVHSGTKFLAGHNDTLCGIAIAKTRALSEKLGFIQNATGGVLSPFDSWLVLRGMKTLALRLKQSQSNAMTIAKWLSNHDQVTAVYYPGLSTHAGYSLQKKQAKGSGAIVSFRVTSYQKAKNILKKVKTISFAESLGGVETLITHPAKQTHADIPLPTRQKLGITDDLLRLSVGIEHIDDLLSDLKQALE